MTYADRVQQLEGEGLNTSDAQGVADAERMGGREFDFDPQYPLDSAPMPRLQPKASAKSSRHCLKCTAAQDRATELNGLLNYWQARVLALESVLQALVDNNYGQPSGVTVPALDPARAALEQGAP